jgi:hypothetical protein
MAGHVYVSFSPSDGSYVQQLIFHLGTAGLSVSTEQQGSAAETIASAAAFVPVVSPHAAHSDQVQREVEQAKAANRPIVPLLLEGGEMPAGLAGIPLEDVTGGRMPPAHFVDQLRRLCAAQAAQAATLVPGGAPGSAGEEAPRFTDAVPVQPTKKSKKPLVLGLVIGFVVLIVLCLGISVLMGLNRLRETSAESALVGDCLTGNTEGGLDAATVKKVDCGSADAKLKVTARLEDKTSDESQAECGKDIDFVYWFAPREDAPGTALCLQKL